MRYRHTIVMNSGQNGISRVPLPKYLIRPPQEVDQGGTSDPEASEYLDARALALGFVGVWGRCRI